MTHFPLWCARRFGHILRFTLRSSRPATKLLIAFLVLPVLPALVLAQPQPEIQWELVNPFRFIHDQSTVDGLRAVFDGLSDKTAAALERKLQDLADEQVKETRRQAAAQFDCARTTVPAEKRKCFEPYAGWFARVAEKNHDKTCWDSKNHKYRTEGACADYVYPKSHRVRVWIAHPESLGDGVPQWIVEPNLATTPCDVKYGRRFCVELAVPYADNPATFQVTAQFPTLTLRTNSPIQVRDRLIVGLGDSFAAGEGNPDKPAEFIDSDLNRDKDFFFTWLAGQGATSYPKKDNLNEAAWLDIRCHRSMYSYQFKTALHLALSNPREAVTYLTFSCSGAVTSQIISDDQSAREHSPDLRPQLQVLREALRNGPKPTRQIDYLLLSTGGNDIGFANYVAYILLRQEWLRGALKLFKGVSEKKMKENFDKRKFESDLLGDANRPGNYSKLQKALLDPPAAVKPTWIRIRGCEAGQPCPRIFLTPYPDVLTDEGGQPCKGNRLEFFDSFGNDHPDRAARIETVRAYVFEQVKTVQQQAGARFGWTLIDGNRDVYLKHGFCAQNSLSQSIGEKFTVPTWVNKKWTGFDPRDYRAYESRSRWFRLPVDSKLTTDQHRKVGPLNLDIALEDVRSNIMHPTAEGLARTADLNFEAIRKIEPVPIPQAVYRKP